jgi:uncharacterized RDD family membrane protein YckC
MMVNEIQFETPENVQVSYQVAGLGTRFVAWFIDTILVWFVAIVVFILVLLVAESTANVSKLLSPESQKEAGNPVGLVIIGLYYIAFSLSAWLYFGLSELRLGGQTLGKRRMGIRVVKADGFSLDPSVIFLRTLFRVIDHLPPMWIVLLLTKKSQRLGDLVAGTIVVADQSSQIGDFRQELMSRSVEQRQFRFDATVLKRARPQDVQAVEKILQGLPRLVPDQQQALLGRLVQPLANRLGVEVPAPSDWLAFVEDFLAAEYRRQYRKLG